MKVLLDPTHVAAVIAEMTDTDVDRMREACGDDPYSISRYMLERYGVDGIARLTAKHAESIVRFFQPMRPNNAYRA
jgi:hypothetical protein